MHAPHMQAAQALVGMPAGGNHHGQSRRLRRDQAVASKLASEGVFAGLASRFHGVPTDYSQRSTNEIAAPRLLQRLRDDGADGAILCPL